MLLIEPGPTIWPYVTASLLLVMRIWTGIIAHALSRLSWPIDFGHCLLYMSGALLIGIQMKFLMDPIGWYCLLVAESASSLANLSGLATAHPMLRSLASGQGFEELATPRDKKHAEARGRGLRGASCTQSGRRSR